MDKKIVFGRSLKDILYASAPFLLVLIAGVIALKFIDPAPPKRIVISTGDSEGDYNSYAKQYRESLKEDGIDLISRPSTGSAENLARLNDPKSEIDVGFVQDGLGDAEKSPELSSLGSLYYEPIWIFYRDKAELRRLTQFMGKKIALGREGGGTHALATQLLKAAGVTEQNTHFLSIASENAATELRNGNIDAAIFLTTAEDPLIIGLMKEKNIKLMSMDQAEAITRQVPYLHHLVLPHGVMDLQAGIPDRDIDLVSPTATLLVKDDMHPALVYLLLKAASQVHNSPGIFEKKNEFPMDKAFQFPLRSEAETFYKSGVPFWQRYLPFWLATLLDRFLLLLLPALAILFPMIKLVPKIYSWRIRSRIYKRYGELKFLETQILPNSGIDAHADYMKKLDAIEDRVNQLKVPLVYSDHIYALRQNIEFVRGRISKKQGIPS